MKVSVIHHGVGNVVSVVSALEHIGADVELADTPDKVLKAERLVLPGVGAAGPYLRSLHAQGFFEAIQQRVRKDAHPFLGICMGMQVMARCLLEYGEHAGFGWIDDQVVSLKAIVGANMRVPHMGWNEIDVTDAKPPPFDDLRRDRSFYFCHSFAFRQSQGPHVTATTGYGLPLVAAVCSETAIGVQFHPERSQAAGDRFLAAFLDWRL